MTISPDLPAIRRFVDDEMAPEENLVLQQHLESNPDVRQRVDFERTLREHIHLVMAENDATPPDLADRIRDTLASTYTPPVAPPALRQSPVVRPPVRETPISRRYSFWNGPTRVNYFAVAASLALISGAVLWGIFGSTISELSHSQPDLVQNIATFTTQEHTRCAESKRERAVKALYRDPEQARLELQKHLTLAGPPPVIFDFSDLGYEFYGGGPCHVPGNAPSFHLIYVHSSPQNQSDTLISIFIVPNQGQLPIIRSPESDFPGSDQSGDWTPLPGGPDIAHRVLCATDDRLIYFMICCDPDIAGLVCSAMRVPGHRR